MAGARAERKIAAADHILTQTYPLVRDPKLLLAVLSNLYEGTAAAALEWLAGQEQLPGDREAALRRFRVAGAGSVPQEFLRLMTTLHETVHEHQRSPVEFVRDDQFVICDEGYRLRTLTAARLKEYVETAKRFARFVTRVNDT